jgi:hypothetical protein
MPTRIFSINDDALISKLSGVTNVGAGADDHLPVGMGSGSTTPVRALLKFYTDWTDMATITSAVIYTYRSSYHGTVVSPNYYIKRVTSSWTEGTHGTDEVWSASNSVHWGNQPTTTSTDNINVASSPAGWNGTTITNIVKAWAPATIPGGGAQTNNGVMFKQTSANSSTADELAGSYTEYESRENALGHDPYILVTYTTSTVPNAPTLNDPTLGEYVASTTPTLNFTPSDPQGDTHTAYTYQVDNNFDLSSPFESTEVTGSFTNAVAVNRVVTTTLSRGTTYYWRVKTKDASGYGPYSAAASFNVAALPTASVTTPANGHTAELWYTAGTSTTPKIRVRWSYADTDGHAQTHVKVKIYADSAGSPGSNVYDSGWVANTGTSFDTTYAATNGTFYHVSVQVRCSLTAESAESTKTRTRVRWGRASYYFDATSAPTSVSVTNNQTVGANEAMVLEYTMTNSTSEPSTWYANVASVALNRYLWHRVTMWGYGSATPSTPDLLDVNWSYSAVGLSLDNWTLASGAAVDTGSYYTGVEALRHDCNSAEQKTYQVVPVLAGRDMVLSGRMRTSGNPAAALRVVSSDGTTVLASVSAPTSTTDWDKYRTSTFNTGSDTNVRIEAYTNAAGGNTAWFDVLKLEEGTVATAWTPGFISGAVTMDSGGIIVDAYKGGIFRLRGSDTGAQATVTLGQWGLEFVSDTAADEPIRVQEVGDSDYRFHMRADGGMRFGGGSAIHDVTFGRTAANELTLGTGDRLQHDFFGCIVTRTSTQAITTATWTAIDFTATDISDQFAFHNPASNSTRVTIPSGWSGTYRCIGQVAIESTGARVIGGFDVNGSGTPANSTLTVSPGGVTATDRQMVVQTVLELSAGDYVEFMVNHTHGSNRNQLADSWFSVQYIGQLA